MRLPGTLTIAGVLALLVAAPAARADLVVATAPAPFESEVGEQSAPQRFQVSATCSKVLSLCAGPDEITIAPAITPGQGGDFLVTSSTCPATMTSGSYAAHPSCSFSVRFAPRHAGPSAATLYVGSGANGDVAFQLSGHGTPSIRTASGKRPAAKKRKCRKAKHRKRPQAAKKCPRKGKARA